MANTAAAGPTLPLPPSRAPSADPRLRAILQDHLLREKDDEVVLAFGRDYFHGARAGAGVGGLVTGAWSFAIYRRMKKDQRLADMEVGLRRGERNPNFSRWVLARGLRTQPMLTVGGCALLATTLLKTIKAYLAHGRCVEFAMDDEEFAMLSRMSSQDPVSRELFEKICSDVTSPAGPTSVPGRGSSVAADAYQSFTNALLESSSLGTLGTGVSGGATAKSCRPPTYWDGVAVGLMGSVMDCHVPMKPLYRYYNMQFGMLL